MRISRWILGVLVVALFASLAGNIFFGSLTVGRAAAPVARPPELVALGPILKSLPEPDRREMRKVFTAHRDDIQHATHEAKEAAHEVQEALLADPYDGDKLKQALATYRTAFLNLRGLMHDVFWEGTETLSPEGRQKLAESKAFKDSALER